MVNKPTVYTCIQVLAYITQIPCVKDTELTFSDNYEYLALRVCLHNQFHWKSIALSLPHGPSVFRGWQLAHRPLAFWPTRQSCQVRHCLDLFLTWVSVVLLRCFFLLPDLTRITGRKKDYDHENMAVSINYSVRILSRMGCGQQCLKKFQKNKI